MKLTSSLDENRLYRAIKNAVYTVVSQYAIHLDEYEIYCMYLFISSMEVFDLKRLSAENLNRYLNEGTADIQKINHEFFASLRETYHDIQNNITPELTNQLYYVVNQIHYKICYFKGTFYFFHGDNISKIVDAETYSVVENVARKQVEFAFSVLGLSPEDKMFEIALRRYFDIVLKVHRFSTNKIFVGMVLHHDFEVISGIVYRVGTFFNSLYHLEIEYALENKKYDLMITDSVKSVGTFRFDHLYLLNELETTYDIEKITATLNRIYKEKY